VVFVEGSWISVKKGAKGRGVWFWSRIWDGNCEEGCRFSVVIWRRGEGRAGF
jgi:hypothetical protein